MNKNKDDTLKVVEEIRKEIYDNLDEILQNHVNALEEKKLLLLKDSNGEDKPDYVQIFNDLSEDLKARLTCVEDQLGRKVDINTQEEKLAAIIDTMSQLEAEIPTKSHLNEIIEMLDEKCNIDDVNKAFEDIYKVLEEKYIDSPLQMKNGSA